METEKKNQGEENKSQGAESRKRLYTEEELNTACNQLYQRLLGEIGKRDEALAVKRLDYLFRVLDHGSCFKPDFVGDCAEEIQAALTPPQPSDGETTQGKGA